MNNFAIVQIAGKQYKARVGGELVVNRLNKTDGGVEFGEVLLVAEDGIVKIGTPFIPNVRVAARVLGEEKGDKLYIVKFRAKSRYRRRTGFRPVYSRIKIESIGSSAEKPVKITRKRAIK